MLKKVIKYVDYDGNPREETFFFNLTKAEVAEMSVSVDGGLDKLIERIVAEQDNKEIIKMFKDMILTSYGEKSPDGRRFVKSQELRNAFSQTEAYSDLFIELATDAGAAAAFVTGIVPSPSPTN